MCQFFEHGKTFRTYLPEQNLLLPASLREWLSDDHLSYFVSDVVDQLDLSAIESTYEGEDRGQPPYHPRKFIVEPVFGQIKQARGFRQFLLRGIEKVRGEWALICMTHNLLKFHKICSG